jgi:ABC-2 type transport system ATP-binding protein
VNLLEVQHITKQYSNHTALSDVSLSVPKGSVYGLLGPNGAGKTTLIRIITQIIAADSGEVLMEGQALNESHVRHVGYLPEERGLYKKMKVGEQLLYLTRLKGLSHAEAMAKLRFWFEKFEISDWWGKKIEDLSKGMQQKVQFIATVLHHPRLIILDEPFSGFDPINANLIKDEILQLRREGSTVIFSTHRMESVEELCDHICLINKSVKILEGPKSQIKKQFRTNTYIIDHRGAIRSGNGHFELVSSDRLDDDLTRSVVTLRSHSAPNELIGDLLGQVELYGFSEKIPTMNEIFISMVKEVERG